MHENMTEEEKVESRLFYSNYRNVIRTINELKKSVSESDLNKLESYKNKLEELIVEMAHYSKTFYHQDDLHNAEYYKSKENIVGLCTNTTLAKIDCHNSLILKTHTADLICSTLGCDLLFGRFGNYIENVDALIQKRFEKIEDVPTEVRLKRLEIFRWAHNAVLLSLTGDKSKSHGEFIDDPMESLTTIDFFELLGEAEIYDTLIGKLNR